MFDTNISISNSNDIHIGLHIKLSLWENSKGNIGTTVHVFKRMNFFSAIISVSYHVETL